MNYNGIEKATGPIPVKVEKEKNGDILVFRLSGDIAYGFHQALTDDFEEALKDDKLKIAIDLKRINFVDSSGLGCFVKYGLIINEKGGLLKLFNVPEPTMRFFNVTRMGDILSIYTDEKEALSSDW